MVAATEYVRLGDAPLALVSDADTAGPRLLWFHADQLGTPQRLTDTAGNLAWDAVLEPFGELAGLIVNLVAQPLRLPGQSAEPAAGLHQNWHRDYDPSLGRYVQPDPLGVAAGSNLYGYVHGNPVSFADPEGRQAETLARFVPILPFVDGPLPLGDMLAVGIVGYQTCKWANRWLSEATAEPDHTPTPETDPDSFQPIRGTSAKENKETGEVLILDRSRHGGPRYEVYRSRKDYERGRRDRAVDPKGKAIRKY